MIGYWYGREDSTYSLLALNSDGQIHKGYVDENRNPHWTTITTKTADGKKRYRRWALGVNNNGSSTTEKGNNESH